MAGDIALDRKSLTLPDWKTALKRRFKRPKKPNIEALFWVLFSIAFLFVDVRHLVTKSDDHPIGFALGIIYWALLGLYWAQQLRHRQPQPLLIVATGGVFVASIPIWIIGA